MVARKKNRLPPERSGSRPGHYIVGTETGGDPDIITGKQHPGRKPLYLMQQLIRDYAIAGDLICDPFAGTGTTLIAAHGMGYDSVGAEKDQGVYDQAIERTIEARHRLRLFA